VGTKDGQLRVGELVLRQHPPGPQRCQPLHLTEQRRRCRRRRQDWRRREDPLPPLA
jgi:hypothetical protein